MDPQLIEQITQLVATFLVTAIGILLTWLLSRLRAYLDEKGRTLMAERLENAVDRAIAYAHAQGVDQERATEVAADYLRRTFGDTLRRAGASDSDIKARLVAQNAQSGVTWPTL